MVSLGVRISVCFTVFTPPCPLPKEIIQPKRRRYEVKIRKNKSTVNTQDARSTWPRSGQVISVIMSIIIVVDSATRFTAPVLNFSSEDLANAGELKLQRSATYNWECSAESLQATAGEMALIATGVPQHKEENEGSTAQHKENQELAELDFMKAARYDFAEPYTLLLGEADKDKPVASVGRWVLALLLLLLLSMRRMLFSCWCVRSPWAATSNTEKWWCFGIASPPNHALRPNISASKVPFILRYHHGTTI